MSVLVFFQFLSSPLGLPLVCYLVVQIVATVSLRGTARIMSLIPAGVMAIVVGFTIAGYVQGSTLWPLFLFAPSFFAISVLALVWLFYRRSSRGEAAYASVATVVLALGVIHMAATFRLSSSPTAKVWFFGTGMAVALGGVLNLLNRRYGLAAFGLRATCIGTNVFMVCLVSIAGRVTGASVLQQTAMLTLLTSALILSAVPSASIVQSRA